MLSPETSPQLEHANIPEELVSFLQKPNTELGFYPLADGVEVVISEKDRILYQLRLTRALFEANPEFFNQGEGEVRRRLKEISGMLRLVCYGDMTVLNLSSTKTGNLAELWFDEPR